MAFWGIDERYAEEGTASIRPDEMGWIVCRQEEALSDHCLFHQIRTEDVVFIKEFSPENGLYIVAVGEVLPGGFVEDGAGGHVAARWLWTGWQHTVEPEDTDTFRRHPIYEEFDIAVQRELIDLLPASGHDPFEMVVAEKT